MEFINEENFKNKHGIYCIKNNISGRCYIGQTRARFIRRYWHHQWKLRDKSHDNQHLQSSWNKYGEDAFSFIIVEDVCAERDCELNDLEIKYIDICRENGKCYNILDGGDGASGAAKSDECKRKIGEKNRINMTGKKHSEETKRKMSEAHLMQHYNADNYVLTEEQAFDVKIMLINGVKPSTIAKDLNISYKIVNGILSNDAWKHVFVEGWDEFRENRKTWTRLSKEDHAEIYKLHIENGYTQQELADMYGKTRQMIGKILKKFREQEHYMTTQCQAS